MNFIPSSSLLAGTLLFGSALGAHAAFLIEIDTDGLDDGVLTYSPNFSYGGDTTTAAQSTPSLAVGLSGGDSIFGGDGINSFDTYLYHYTPSTGGGDIDNLALPNGTVLNAAGDVSSGLIAGSSGSYIAYATWPLTTNVSGGPTLFEMTHDSGMLSVLVDQNDGGLGTGDEWIRLGVVTLTEGNDYVLSQSSTVFNSFISMRASAVMFDRIERVPEPSAAALVLAGLLPAARRRRKSWHQ